MRSLDDDAAGHELAVDLDVLTRLCAARDSARLALTSEGEERRAHEDEAFAHFDEAARLLHEGSID